MKQPVAGECVEFFYLPAKPVCGCDGKTYGSDCQRQVAGVARAHEGQCDQPTPCPALDEAGCIARTDCAAGYVGFCDCTCPGPKGYEGGGCANCSASCFAFQACVVK